MERRKVQVTGGSTFIVSLPKKWIDAQGIRRGDAVDVLAEQAGPVTIYPVGRKPSPRRIARLTLDARRPTTHTERRVIGAYLAGYETLAIESTGRFPPEHKQAIRRLAQTLIGIEIVDESQRSITLQDLLDPLDFSMDKAIERMQQLARSMVADALASIRGNDKDLAQDIPMRDPEVDRLDWMVVKQFHLVSTSGQLAGQLGTNPSEALHYLFVSRALERIADHAARLGEIMTEPGAAALPKPTREQVAGYGETVLGLLDRAYQSFQRSDVDAGNDVLTECHDVAPTSAALLGKGKGHPAASQVGLALLVKSIERIRSYTMDVAEAAIDHHMLRLAADGKA